LQPRRDCIAAIEVVRAETSKLSGPRSIAGFLGMSPEVLPEIYGHHHPDCLRGAAMAIGQKERFVRVVETVASIMD
jgi:hypothetical protein